MFYSQSFLYSETMYCFAVNLFYNLFFVLAMILMYMTYTWGNAVHKQGMRKNAADYENDE